MTDQFDASDFAEVALLLRLFVNEDSQKFQATLSNNSNIILAALDLAAEFRGQQRRLLSWGQGRKQS